MQGDFEKKISQRMQDFSIAPQPEIWQQVEAALPPEKKRRIALWWWLLPLVITLGGGIWLIVSRQPIRGIKEKIVAQHNPLTITQSPKHPQVENLVKTTSVKQPIVQIDKRKMKHSPRFQSDSVLDRKEVIFTTNRTDKIPAFPVVAQQKRLSHKVNQSFEKWYQLSAHSLNKAKRETLDSQADFSPAKSGKGLQTYAGTTPPAKPIDAFNQLTKDSIAVLPVTRKIVIDSTDTAEHIIDTVKVINTVAKKLSSVKKRPTWMVETGAGQSWQQQFLAGSNNVYAYSQNTTSPVNNQPVNYPSFVSSKAGASISLGIARKQAISRHWNWQLALRYQLLSITQPYGSVSTSPSGYSLAGAARMYTPGDTLVYHSYVHQVQLVPRIEYTIHPDASFPVSIHTGLSVAYAVSSNQLLHDYRTYNYLRSPAYTTKWLYAAEVGATVFIYKKVYAGLLYQYGLTNIARPALQSDYRWQVWQASTGLPLFHHSSK